MTKRRRPQTVDVAPLLDLLDTRPFKAVERFARVHTSVSIDAVVSFAKKALNAGEAALIADAVCSTVSESLACRGTVGRDLAGALIPELARLIPRPSACRALASIVAYGTRARKAELLHAVPVIVSSMHEESSLHLAISLMDHNAQMRDAFRRAGAGDRLLRIIENGSTHERAQHLAMRALSEVVHRFSEQKYELLEKDALPAIVRMLALGNRHAAFIVGQLARLDDARSGDVKVVLGQLGCVVHLGAMLRSSRDTEYAAFALSRLLSNRANQTAMVLGGFVGDVLGALSPGHRDVHHHLVFILYCLAETRRGALELLARGAIPHLVFPPADAYPVGRQCCASALKRVRDALGAEFECENDNALVGACLLCNSKDAAIRLLNNRVVSRLARASRTHEVAGALLALGRVLTEPIVSAPRLASSDGRGGTTTLECRAGFEAEVSTAALVDASPVFRAMLAGPYAESATNRVHVSSVSPAALRTLRDYLNDGSLREVLPQDVLVQLFKAASMYQMDALRSECECQLADFIAASTVSELHDFAVAHRAPALVLECVLFALERARAGKGWSFITDPLFAEVESAFEQAALGI